MNENKPTNEPAVNEEGLAESNAAKRLRLTGEGISFTILIKPRKGDRP